MPHRDQDVPLKLKEIRLLLATILAESETVCTNYPVDFLSRPKAAPVAEGDASNTTLGPFSKANSAGTLTTCYRSQVVLR